MVKVAVLMSSLVAANKPIFKAVMENDAAKVRELIAAGQDINEQMLGSLQSPLMASCLGGHLEVAKALLELGADVTVPEMDGYTPMHGAAFQGRAELVKALLDHGVPISGTEHKDGYAPFHRACWGVEERHSQTVQVFLDNGVDPNLPAGNGVTCERMTRNDKTKEILKNANAKLNDEL